MPVKSGTLCHLYVSCTLCRFSFRMHCRERNLFRSPASRSLLYCMLLKGQALHMDASCRRCARRNPRQSAQKTHRTIQQYRSFQGSGYPSPGISGHQRGIRCGGGGCVRRKGYHFRLRGRCPQTSPDPCDTGKTAAQ